MNKTIAVIAPTYKAYSDYVRRNFNISNKFIFVNTIPHCLGYKFDDLVTLSFYKDIPDVDKIIEYIKSTQEKK
jgi:hypothetical protein